MLTAANGVKVDALTVFSLSLKYMKDKAFEVIQDETGDRNYTTKDIQWVITVPAIWTPGAKQFMREAAYQVWESRLCVWGGGGRGWVYMCVLPAGRSFLIVLDLASAS